MWNEHVGPSRETITSVSAAKRRKNTAHGASRGWNLGQSVSPGGAKEEFLDSLDVQSLGIPAADTTI